MCATHSQPAFVGRPCWKSAVATSALLANCFAMVRATNRRTMSPTMIPLTPRSGFANAVNLQKRMPSITSSRTSATANLDATCTNNSKSASLSRMGNRCHSRLDLGTIPGCPQTHRVEHLHPIQKPPLVQIAWALVGVGAGVCQFPQNCPRSWRHGAFHSLPSKACRAADNSPRRTKLGARSTRLWIPSSCLCRRRRLTDD